MERWVMDSLPSTPQRPDLPAVVLEAQMAHDPGFLLRLYAETGRFLQQQAWNGDWRVVVICPHRGLHFGALTPPAAQVRRISAALHQQAGTDPDAAEVLPLISSILITRFRDKSIPEICAMGGLTLEDFTQSKAYKEIFGLGEAKMTLLLLNRRCGPLSEATTARIQALLDFSGPEELTTWLAANA